MTQREPLREITRNAVRCDACLDEIESTHRHDFRFCKCGAIAVDGGKEYLRRVGAIHKYTELSEYVNSTKENSGESGAGSQPVLLDHGAEQQVG